MSPEEFKKIPADVKTEDHFYSEKDLTGIFPKLKKVILENKGNKINLSDNLRRMSMLSGLSGSSSGYHADISNSGGASSIGASSTSDKRDRLSIMPDAAIEVHKILSPLPLKRKILADKKLPDGRKVFAKWVERTETKYWPGSVKEDLGEKYMILFEDGYEKLVTKEDIIAADDLLPGCQVNVETDDEGVHQQGVILSRADCSDKADVFYTIQLEGCPPALPETDAEAFSFRKIHLTLPQWRKMRDEMGPQRTNRKSLGEVSLDNLQVGKRCAKPVTPLKKSKPMTPEVQKTPVTRRNKKGGDNVDTSVHEDGETTEVSLAYSSGEEKMDRKTARQQRRGPNRNKLFKGMTFLITQSQRKRDFKEDVAESAMESETEDEADDTLEELPLNRKDLRKKIEDNGGRFLERFPDKEKITDKIIVLSDGVCRTMTYLLSIAFGFERIHFSWVLNSLVDKKLLSRQNYMLQVGYR